MKRLASPRFRNGQSEGIGSVCWLWDLGQPQNFCHQGANLPFGGAPVPGNRGLDFAGGSEGHRYRALMSERENYTADVRRSHHRGHVMLSKDPLQRHNVGCKLIQNLRQRVRERSNAR